MPEPEATDARLAEELRGRCFCGGLADCGWRRAAARIESLSAEVAKLRAEAASAHNAATVEECARKAEEYGRALVAAAPRKPWGPLRDAHSAAGALDAFAAELRASLPPAPGAEDP